MCDTNAWSEALWNMDRTSARGEVFEDFILSHGLLVQNKGNKFTYVRYNAQTIIDVTMSSPGLNNNIQHWNVRDAVAYSDHCSIEFVLKLSFFYKKSDLLYLSILGDS